MPRISHNKGVNRKLIAVIGGTKDGFFVRNDDDESKCHYVRLDTTIPEVGKPNCYSLEEALKADQHRVGVYEGDSITIQF